MSRYLLFLYYDFLNHSPVEEPFHIFLDKLFTLLLIAAQQLGDVCQIILILIRMPSEQDPTKVVFVDCKGDLDASCVLHGIDPLSTLKRRGRSYSLDLQLWELPLSDQSQLAGGA